MGPDVVVQVVDEIRTIQEHLRAAHDRQKSWVDSNRRPLEFKAGEHVFLRIFPSKRVMRFGAHGKMNPSYTCPFEILERVGEVVYILALPPSLEGVHNVFHVSQLRRYIRDESHVLDY